MHDSLKRLEQQPALYKSVQDAVREYILSNGLKPGAPLPSELQLARLLGVSRNSIREAIKALQLVGLVDSRRGSGIFVGEFSLDPILDNLPFSLMPDVKALFDLIEIRRVLETGMIASAMQSMNDEQLQRLEGILMEMHSLALQGKKSPHADRLFHQTLYENLNNQTFLKLLDIFWQTFNRLSDKVDAERYSPINLYENHVAIFNAVKNGDVAAAQQCLSEHYHFELRSPVAQD